MSMITEVKTMVDSIASSRRQRKDCLLAIRGQSEQGRADARSLVETLLNSRRENGRESVRHLAADNDRRKSATAQILSQSRKLRENHRREHTESGNKLRQTLSRDAAERRRETNEILLHASNVINNHALSRKNSGLRQTLAESRKVMTEKVAGLRNESSRLIGDFRSVRNEAGRSYRSSLSSDRARRAREVKDMRKNILNIRKNIKAELREADAYWRQLSQEMITSAATPDMEEKLCQVINQHPEGITLTGAAGSLGVVPIVLGRLSKKLVSGGKIRKQDKLYFSVSG